MRRIAAISPGLRLAAALALAAVASGVSGCGRSDRKTDADLRAEIAALERERDTLRTRLEALAGDDAWAQGMPEASVRIGVPTSLAARLIQHVASGFVDHVTIELQNLRVRKRGEIKKIVTLGRYDLRVNIDRVTGRLKTELPEVTFGGNRVKVALPINVVSGTGRATIDFKWDGKSIGGVVCGDQDIQQVVTGGVRPLRHTVAGALALSATPQGILAEPIFPLIRIKLHVKPSDASWAAARQILDDKSGVCGFVLDRVNPMGYVEQLIEKGFDVRLPAEKIKPLALPVEVSPSITVRDETVALGIKVSDLAITGEMIWLGAEVKVGVDEPADPRRGGTKVISLTK